MWQNVKAFFTRKPIHIMSAILSSPCDIKYDFSAGQYDNSQSIAGSRLMQPPCRCGVKVIFFLKLKKV